MVFLDAPLSDCSFCVLCFFPFSLSHEHCMNSRFCFGIVPFFVTAMTPLPYVGCNTFSFGKHQSYALRPPLVLFRLARHLLRRLLWFLRIDSILRYWLPLADATYRRHSFFARFLQACWIFFLKRQRVSLFSVIGCGRGLDDILSFFSLTS